MIHVIEHSLLDSLKVLAAAIILNIILSFFESKLSKLMNKKNKLSPVIGSLVGLIPQCGVGVVASDLYNKGKITRGTIVALFLACSDEALPILLSESGSAIYLIPMILSKFIIGFIVGYLVDFGIAKKEKVIVTSEDSHHIGCCHHEIEEESSLKRHLIHPVIHSLKIFLYVFVINFVFEYIIYLFGEENIVSFFSSAKYLSPLIATLIGLIPNCASSVIICEAFVNGAIGFGSALAGLCANAGLGLIYIFKGKKTKEEIKDSLLIAGLLVLTALVVGYVTSFIIGF